MTTDLVGVGRSDASGGSNLGIAHSLLRCASSSGEWAISDAFLKYSLSVRVCPVFEGLVSDEERVYYHTVANDIDFPPENAGGIDFRYISHLQTR